MRRARPPRPAATALASPGGASDASSLSDSTLASAGGSGARPPASPEYLSEERLSAHTRTGGEGGVGAAESKRTRVLEWQAAGEAARRPGGGDRPHVSGPERGGDAASREALQSQLARAERVMQHQREQLDAVNNVKVATMQRRQDELQEELVRLRAQVPAAASAHPGRAGPETERGRGHADEEQSLLLVAKREARQRAEKDLKALERSAQSERGELVARLQRADADLRRAQASARGQESEHAERLRQEEQHRRKAQGDLEALQATARGQGHTQEARIQAEREARLQAEEELLALKRRESELTERLQETDASRARAEEDLRSLQASARGRESELAALLQQQADERALAEENLRELQASARGQHSEHSSRFEREQEDRRRIEEKYQALQASAEGREKELAQRLKIIEEDRRRAGENLQELQASARGQKSNLILQLQREQQKRTRAEADLQSLHRSAKEQESEFIARLRAEEEQRLRAEEDLRELHESARGQENEYNSRLLREETQRRRLEEELSEFQNSARSQSTRAEAAENSRDILEEHIRELQKTNRRLKADADSSADSAREKNAELENNILARDLAHEIASDAGIGSDWDSESIVSDAVCSEVSVLGSEISESEASTKLFSRIRNGRYKEFKRLLDSGHIHPDERDDFGNTMLIAAAQNNRKRITKAVIEFGTPLNAKNDKGQTALHCCYEFGYTALAEYIVSKGANLCIPNAAGMMPREGYA